MQFSSSLEHAFHSLFYMIDLPKHKAIGIKKIAEIHNLADSYLSKIFAKLTKAGIVRSVPGVNGGYQLAKHPNDISFLDVLEAIEGTSSFFQCAELRERNIFEKNPEVYQKQCPCLIKVVMMDAEEQFRNSLKTKSLLWLHTNVKDHFSPETKQAIFNWAENI